MSEKPTDAELVQRTKDKMKAFRERRLKGIIKRVEYLGRNNPFDIMAIMSIPEKRLLLYHLKEMKTGWLDKTIEILEDHTRRHGET